MRHDVIVVGAGLGGLTAGAKLAREGKKVLVIEQHSKPGGCATTFTRGSYTLEVGLHEMNGPSPSDMKPRGLRRFCKDPVGYRQKQQERFRTKKFRFRGLWTGRFSDCP